MANQGFFRRMMMLAALPLAWGAVASGCAVPPPDDIQTEDEESVVDSEAEVGSGTVEQATNSSCSTASIKPLSQQIIDEMRCMKPDMVVELPSRPNLVLTDAVFPYVVKPARDAMVGALDAKPNTKMTVNSMLRTVTQQYMVRRWYEQGRCGIAAAATPGNSNHETGLAIDISENSTWRSALETRGFKWFGNGDKPHFDYTGSGAQSQKGLDVEAFQRLWNRNNPNDKISADGVWGPQTRQRVQKAPAKGFAVGAQCGEEIDPQEPQDPQDPAAECSDFSSSEFSCSPDGNSRGLCDAGQVDLQPCSNGCLIQTGNDVCMGTTSSWSCNGSVGTTKMENGTYVGTSFGCSIAEDGSEFSDPGDNCIPACLSTLKSQGICSSSMTGKACEKSITWFSADKNRFGCASKIRVTNPDNGRSAVLMVIDAGPACWVEDEAGTGVLDMSYRATEYLFGESLGVVDNEKVHVVEVSADTPLGPVQ
jgi:hypothetical protein